MQSLLINDAAFNNVLLAFFQRLNVLNVELLHVAFTAFVQLQNRFQTIMISNFAHDFVEKQILLSDVDFGKLKMHVLHAYTVHRTRHSMLRHAFFLFRFILSV